MDFGIGTYGLGYLAGVLSILSPCVLPLLPIVLGTALGAHRWGPLALTAGLMLSFSTAGIAVASVGASIGLESEWFRQAAAVMLLLFGIILMSSGLQARLATASVGMSNAANTLMDDVALNGLAGQFGLGLLLGLVWSPCVGPTLGAAMVLASQGNDLAHVALLMAIFGLGAGTPMVILGRLSRSTIHRLREKMLLAGRSGKYALGILLMILGAVILAGMDKDLEILMVENAPDSMVELGTRF